MGVPKPLHLGSDISDLQKSAKLGDTSKWSAKALCQSSEKVFKEAVIQKDLGELICCFRKCVNILLLLILSRVRSSQKDIVNQ